MHELGVVFHIIKTIEDVAQEENLTKVSKVVLEVGEVSTVLPDLLHSCWDWSCKRSALMNGCQLERLTIPAVTYCEDCGKTYETVRFGRTCPYCQSGETYLVTGNQCIIKEIEAEENEEGQ